MDLYPFNLVLAVATASATLFVGYLSPRLLRADILMRQPLRLGIAWLAVACTSSPEILHYDVGLALLCFVAWWRLRGDHGLSGKLWLCLAAGLGISLGVVLILAVAPGAWPPDRPVWAHLLFLVSLYIGGAVVGLAYVLYVFTRPAASRAGVSFLRLTRWLFRLILIEAGLAVTALWAVTPIEYRAHIPWGMIPRGEFFNEEFFALFCCCTVLPILATLALRHARSPRPSTAGPALLTIMAVGFIAAAAPLL